MSIKIAFIGAGSLAFSRRLMADIMTVKELQDTEFHFMDIDKRNLDMVTAICQRDLEHSGLKATITPTMNRRDAIRDADYVVCMIRHGGLEAFKKDVEIPLKYGVDQCVGDTLCAGGITYAQRHIPVLLDIAKDIEELAKPNALFTNYANPMAMNSWAVERYSNVRYVGLCHGVEAGFRQICRALALPEDEVDYTCAGINHQTWFTNITHKGKDMLPLLLDAYENNPELSAQEKVRIDVMRRFGYYSTESNGHLSEYLPWYRKRPEEITRWIDFSTWSRGETAGYLNCCLKGRDWFKKGFPKKMEQPPQTYEPENRSHEHFSYIVEAEQTGRLYRGHFNLPNDGIITNLPDNCIVEVPGFVDKLGIHPQTIGDLPLACAALLRNSIGVQELAVEAAVHGDVTLFKQALLMDPLTAAVCNPEEIWQMGDELLVETSEWLPQYDKKEIDAARKRLMNDPPTYERATKGHRHDPDTDIAEEKTTGTDMHTSLGEAGV